MGELDIKCLKQLKVNNEVEIIGKSTFFDNINLKGNMTINNKLNDDSYLRIYCGDDSKYSYLNMGKNNTNYWQMFYR